jgi:hypothetical protein
VYLVSIDINKFPLSKKKNQAKEGDLCVCVVSGKMQG